MLSRIAESLFWIGRYVERAEDTARILDVQTQMMLEDHAVNMETASRTLLSVMGAGVPDGEVSLRSALDRLAYDVTEPTSIAAALAGARESARRARETLSTEMWEVINSTYRYIPSGRFRAMRMPEAFRFVRERSAAINGTAEATMSRDEGWQFLVLGRSLERADMTARLVATSSLSPGATSAWPTTLRACGAYQSFLRAYRGLETDRQAAEYLLLDRLFPRSVVHALTEAEEALSNLESNGQRVGFLDEARRLLGRTRAELEYRSISDIATDLPGEMERLQRTCAAASDAVTQRYFSHAVAMNWQGGLAR